MRKICKKKHAFKFKFKNIIYIILIMTTLKNKIIEECLNTLKRDDVKEEIKELMSPVIDMFLKEIYPYIYLSMIFVIISFLLILGIFLILVRSKLILNIIKNKKSSSK
tara:strand:+ start:5213 stop:5536 length:324 start_codon:yes stop_codon:yes gene_type:complete